MPHVRSNDARMRRSPQSVIAPPAAVALLLPPSCNADRLSEAPPTQAPSAPAYASSAGGPMLVVNVSNDTAAQNETPLAVNPVTRATCSPAATNGTTTTAAE
jgi:hypothetical protein